MSGGYLGPDPAFDAELLHAIESARVEGAGDAMMAHIQRQTAITWAARSIAAYERFGQTGDVRDLLAADEFGNEGIEHGALAEDAGLLGRIVSLVQSTKARTLEAAGLVTSARLGPGSRVSGRW